VREELIKAEKSANKKEGYRIDVEDLERFIEERNPLYAEVKQLRQENAQLKSTKDTSIRFPEMAIFVLYSGLSDQMNQLETQIQNKEIEKKEAQETLKKIKEAVDFYKEHVVISGVQLEERFNQTKMIVAKGGSDNETDAESEAISPAQGANKDGRRRWQLDNVVIVEPTERENDIAAKWNVYIEGRYYGDYLPNIGGCGGWQIVSTDDFVYSRVDERKIERFVSAQMFWSQITRRKQKEVETYLRTESVKREFFDLAIQSKMKGGKYICPMSKKGFEKKDEMLLSLIKQIIERKKKEHLQWVRENNANKKAPQRGHDNFL
jgi:hypothetical protein